MYKRSIENERVNIEVITRIVLQLNLQIIVVAIARKDNFLHNHPVLNLICSLLIGLKMNLNIPHYCAHVTRQVSSTRRSRQVLARIQTVCVYHKIAIAHVYFGRFRLIFLIEKLWQSSLLDLVQTRVVKPRGV